MHIVLCMSPVGEPFRNRIRMFPSFVNCSTIDWFSEWPNDALLEVAEKYLADVVLFLGDEEVSMMAHAIVAELICLRFCISQLTDLFYPMCLYDIGEVFLIVSSITI
ncbi:unnamed protein product [Protopolystoma xenopodis]|uniref:Dynein heavy chain AAA module D4 domain-containing protein n=1 Tax=Protopolystoma xenopodis TaxID=117903 RepID=A0A448XQP0_9PLAT|nr:unnamed protein product [Protopolystoma xenopodis]